MKTATTSSQNAANRSGAPRFGVPGTDGPRLPAPAARGEIASERVTPRRGAIGFAFALAAALPAAPVAAKVPSTAAGQPQEPAAAVSLQQLLQHAEVNAPALSVARARLQRAEAALADARPRLPDNPVVSAGVGPRMLGQELGVDAQVTISQQVEVAGERRLRLAAARRQRELLEAELDAARWETHWKVHAAFHRALVTREKAEVAKRLLEFQEQLLDIAQRRLKSGDDSPLPVRLAEGETAQAKVAYIAARQAYQFARLELARLTGWSATRPPAPAGVLDPPRPAPPLEHIVQLALRHQPALRVARSSVAEAAARQKLARRDAWPEPSFGVQFQRESIEGGAGEYVVLGTIAIPVPLFRRNQGERATARADENIATAELSARRQQLDAELAQSAGAVNNAAERVAAYGQEILPTFEENLRLLERAYALGEIDITEVSVARERFLRIQNDALDAYDEYFQAVSALESAVGTDLWPAEDHRDL